MHEKFSTKMWEFIFFIGRFLKTLNNDSSHYFSVKNDCGKKGQVIALLGKRCQDYDWVQGTSPPVPYCNMGCPVSKRGIPN